MCGSCNSRQGRVRKVRIVRTWGTPIGALRLCDSILAKTFTFLLINSSPLNQRISTHVRRRVVSKAPSFGFDHRLLSNFINFVNLSVIRRHSFLRMNPCVVFPDGATQIGDTFRHRERATMKRALLFKGVVNSSQNTTYRQARGVLRQVQAFIITTRPFQFVSGGFKRVTSFCHDNSTVIQLADSPRFQWFYFYRLSGPISVFLIDTCAPVLS